jgi:hypothetical protein
MEKQGVQVTSQKAREEYPDAKPLLISNNGKQFRPKSIENFYASLI